MNSEECKNRLLIIEAKAREAETRANEALYHYNMVVNSTSWKITKPLRILGIFLRRFVRGDKLEMGFQGVEQIDHHVDESKELSSQAKKIYNKLKKEIDIQQRDK